ncbi:EAL domain-containing protein [Duganella sp. FT135W]|uniref:EAL domain-containing protein n=1 Tax=Duganella flavida TaxID=2692175 RepID=A0A6L8K5H0_9BURK|nr:EAL domain-containing response regulator [Duganella flavida]MYM22626.1 EAL domain-containing protein [Duganella flavida]
MNIENLNFLLVEDHDFQRRALRRMLAGLGANSITDVADGGAALTAFEQARQPFDVCFIDLNMPGMDGMELVRHLAEAQSKVSIILLSALDRALISSVETMVKAYGIHLLGAMEKPATPAAIEQLLCRLKPGSHGSRSARGSSHPAFPEPSMDELTQALVLGQFEPFFQPKACLTNGTIHSAEALARWRHPQRGLVPPDSFIPLLEQHGLIDQLTEQIVQKTARAWQSWSAQGKQFEVSINLSLSSLSNPGYAARLIAILDHSGIAPRFIVFEVTESAAMSDVPHSLENLARLRMKGYGLSIDDYGTGYSSMQQLIRIPFSELKMDRSFVTAACKDNAQVLVLASSLALAKELRLDSVAEGIESASDWRLLRRLECRYAQGYLIGKPVPQAEFLDSVAGWSEAYANLPHDVRADAAETGLN